MKEPVNEVLTKMRLNWRMTQAEAGQTIGVTQSTISRLESGGIKPSADQLIQLCAVYGGGVIIQKAPLTKFANGAGGVTMRGPV